MSLEKQLNLLKQIDNCFLALNGKKLPSPLGVLDRYLWLHEKAPYSILAQGGEEDPYFIYANNYALSCFKYSLDEILSLPAKLSAAEENRPKRKLLFDKVAREGIVYNYNGDRVDKYQNTFRINDTIVWQLEENDGEVWGQGALFWSKEKERPRLVYRI
ncbi:MEKHLA domain-containing protein [Flavobacterium sp. LS1R49]|uniref:MEKHLA domain-containing protein n=1 Tax=Flavobacterium shii TaxID=2987687 RepID=A0A9X2ZD02_9FLAO|nr:MEKHLA domain-containing protein [Flavobacterium shii]MCV9927075.1 MEKHLA domain-containing protein [Flavobacterium shii]